MNAAIRNVWLATGVLALSVWALAMSRPELEEAFSGADGQANELVGSLRPGYEPWFSPLWEPPSGEIEGLLFSLQAAIGAGALCYALGFWRGRRASGGGRA